MLKHPHCCCYCYLVLRQTFVVCCSLLICRTFIVCGSPVVIVPADALSSIRCSHS